ncbi:MAG: glycosyltransferase [Thermomicrobiales bacterium]
MNSWDVVPSAWEFPAQYIPVSPRFGHDLRLPLRSLRLHPPDVFVSLLSDPSFMAGHLAASAYAKRTAVRVLPTYDSWFHRSRFKEALKHTIFRNVDAVKVPGPDGAAQAHRYGMPHDRIYTVTQSIDVAHYQRGASISDTARAHLRQTLGVHGFVFLYVGRLWKNKGLDYLFDAFAELRKTRDDVYLVLVGDGVDEHIYRSRWESHPGVVFAGFIQPRDIPPYFGMADALVFPTLGDPNGLVVEEAMAAALPVISTTSAGDISRRLEDGKMGYLVPPADSQALTLKMQELAANSTRARLMGQQGHRRVLGMAHEQYAIDFERFVEAVLNKPSRRNAITRVSPIAGRLVPLQKGPS